MSIRVENISKIIDGKEVLKDISFEINDGDFVTLLGETGAGKTTLLRILAGIEKPTKGKVYFDGKNVTNISVQKRNVAMVYQQFINYPSMTIYENIASPLKISRMKRSKAEIDKKVKARANLLGISHKLHNYILHHSKVKLPKAVIDEKVKANAKLLGIAHILDHYPEEVSGGQKQRTAIARALTKESNFILLDEPLANLDFKLREELRGELKRIFRTKGGCIIYATPDPLDALSMSTHVGFMHHGQILQFGPVKEVYKNPQIVEVGAYFSYPTMNISDCQVAVEDNKHYLKITDQFKVDVSSFHQNLNKSEYLLGVHAHSLNPVKEKQNSIPIKATVELSEVVGSDTELHVTHQGIGLIVLTQDIVTYDIGEEIEIFLDPDDVYVFDKESRQLVFKTATE